MNFLAHLYLSGNDNEILIGNFIADAVKGRKALEQFPERVKKGIIIHREIDFFMDNHPIVKKGQNRLRESYPKFSGVIMDIFYDHFLAKNWKNYHQQNLPDFIKTVFSVVDENKHLLLGKAKAMYPYMKRDNWLLSYESVDGIESILKKMTKRINHKVSLNNSVRELQENYSDYETEFTFFFKDIVAHLNRKFEIELK